MTTTAASPVFCPFPEVTNPTHSPLTAIAMAKRGFSVTVIYPPGYPHKEGEQPNEGKRPSGNGWGQVTLTPKQIEGKVWRIHKNSGLIANNGICLGPGKAPDGRWLIDIEIDGPTRF
jgi:hypothetical protein